MPLILPRHPKSYWAAVFLSDFDRLVSARSRWSFPAAFSELQDGYVQQTASLEAITLIHQNKATE